MTFSDVFSKDLNSYHLEIIFITLKIFGICKMIQYPCHVNPSMVFVLEFAKSNYMSILLLYFLSKGVIIFGNLNF